MSDYVEGEDCWKKVKHTNLSDAQADIAALQARIKELKAKQDKLRELFDRWESSRDVVAMSYAAQAKLCLKEQGDE